MSKEDAVDRLRGLKSTSMQEGGSQIDFENIQGEQSDDAVEWSRLFHESMNLLWQRAQEEKGANEKKIEEEGQQEREADSLVQT